MTGPRVPLSDVSAVKLALLARDAREQHSALLRADPIAVIGMGCRFPGGADSPAKFWDLLANGVDAVSDVPPDRWDAAAVFDADPSVPGKSVTKRGGFLDRIDTFDAEYFGILPREAQQMDPQQRVFLEVAMDALDDAGLSRDRLRGARASVYVASYHNDYAHLQYADRESVDARTLTGNVHSVLANRLSYVLDLRGPSISIDTACSSSLVAIHLACQSLRFGESDLSIAGGVSLMVTPDVMVALSKVGFMAPDGRCKTFDASADGFGRGEGCGVVILKRLSDAIADGDRVYAVVRGSAVNQDGHSTVLAAPNGLAQQALIRDALASAQLEPSRISYVEAHGTGTMLGDPIEVEAIAATIGAPADTGPCLIGAAKANIAHMEAAAGVGGFIKVVLSMQHEAIPAQPNFTTLNPHISLSGTRLEIPTALTPWPRGSVPRRAGTSGFGVGGTNAHVVIEEAPRFDGGDVAADGDRAWLVPVSAQSPDALRALVQRWIDFLPGTSSAVSDLAFTSGARRSHLRYRATAVGRTREELLARFDSLRAVEPQAADEPPRVAFVFSGQGPQWYAMGRQLLESEPVFRDAMRACDEEFAKVAAWSILEELRAPEQESRLQHTEVAQPALVAVQIALSALWESWGVMPSAVAGHSVGEIAALHVAGVLSLPEAMRVVHQRGRVMEAATGGGRMAAVAIDAADADALVRPYGARLGVGAYNSPRSVVLSGEAEVLQEALAALARRNVGHRMLPVQYAFHSTQMAPLQKQLTDQLRTVTATAPRIPVYSTVTGGRASGVTFDAEYFGRNVREPVRLAGAVEAMLADGYRVFLEVGPHPVLNASLLETAEPHADALILSSLRRGKHERETLLQTAGALYVRGVSLNWERFGAADGNVVSLPSYPWQRKRYWLSPPRAALPAATADDTGHPLLGRRLSIAGDSTRRVYEAQWADGCAGGFQDHRIGERPVLPAAAMLEMFRAAADDAGGSAYNRIESFTVLRPLFLANQQGSPSAWQIAVEVGNERLALELHERIAEDARDSASSEWRLVATAGAARAISDVPVDTSVPATEPVPASAFYGRLASLGANFGNAFQTLDQIVAGNGVATATIRLQPAISGETTSFAVHPALVDGALQLCTAAAAPGEGNVRPAGLFLPVSVEAFEVLRQPGESVVATARVRSDTPEGLIADVSMRDDTGTIATVAGVRFAIADISKFAAVDAIDSWIHEIAWREHAATPAMAGSAGGDWLILADKGGFADRLCAALEQHGGRCSTVTSDLSTPDAAAEVIGTWRRSSDRRGVINLRALDTSANGSNFESEDLNAAGTALHVIQALLRGNDPHRETVWLVTRGAQMTEPTATRVAVAAAGMWGFAGAVSAEHEDIRIRLVDLDAADATDAADEAADLANEIVASADAPQALALRSGRRLSPRIERMRIDGPARRGALSRVVAGETRTIDALQIVPATGRDPGRDEIRIDVHATGLNFRDVLVAVGMYPVTDIPFGVECAGTVTAVGADVRDFKPGDVVFAFARASMATDVCVPARFASLVPPTLTPAQAAVVPAAFLTAHYALHEIAKLGPGQRVLIHAAAGGVGQAAVQLARRAGAEVFATAGSPPKRDYLRAAGIEHVMDSRTLSFAEELRSATNGDGVDVVLNSLTGDFINAGIASLAKNGWFIELGKRDVWTPSAVANVRADVKYRAFDLGDELDADPGLFRSMIDDILAGFADGTLQPLPVEVFSLARVQDAFRFMAQAKHIGKIAVQMPSHRRAAAPLVRGDATYWITGGFGALGLHTASWLAASGARHLVLTGRRGPSNEAGAAIESLRERGVNVRTLAADVGNPADVARIRDDIAATSAPLRGVIHAAGVTDDGMMLSQTWDRMRSVLHGKAHGARVLDAALQDVDLDFFVSYSSASTILGAPGQASYAAANAELDAVAANRHARGQHALSIAWGQWADSGMAAALAARGADPWSRRGLGKIHPAEAFQRVEALLRANRVYAAVLPIDWGQFMSTLPAGVDRSMFSAVEPRRAKAPAATNESDAAGALRTAPAAQRRTILMKILSERATHTLGLPAGSVLDPKVPLREAGLDSLMSVELANSLSRVLGCRLAVTSVFDYPTLDALAGHVSDVLGFNAPVDAPSDLSSQRDEARAAVEALSNEEAEALLLAELEGKPVPPQP